MKSPELHRQEEIPDLSGVQTGIMSSRPKLTARTSGPRQIRSGVQTEITSRRPEPLVGESTCRPKHGTNTDPVRFQVRAGLNSDIWRRRPEPHGHTRTGNCHGVTIRSLQRCRSFYHACTVLEQAITGNTSLSITAEAPLPPLCTDASYQHTHTGNWYMQRISKVGLHAT